MHKVLLFFIFFSISVKGFTQPLPPKAIDEYKLGLRPFDNLLLFNLQEIQLKKIDSVYIIYHPSSWASLDTIANTCTCNYNDTLFLYTFYKSGKIKSRTDFKNLNTYSETYNYDTLGMLTSITKKNSLNRVPIKTYPYSKDTVLS